MSAISAPEAPVGSAPLDDTTLQQAATEALATWGRAAPSADLSGITFSVADLPDLEVGRASGRAVVVDLDAAGWGWSVTHPAEPWAHIALHSTLLHEVGHVLGLAHATSGLMAETIAPGEAHGISSEDAAAAQPAPAPSSDPSPAQAPTEESTGTTTSTEVSSEAGASGSTTEVHQAAATATTAWAVDGTTATFVGDGGALDGTLRFDGASGSLVIDAADGTSHVVSLVGVSSVVIQGTEGSDALTIDASVAASGVAIAFFGGGGDDTLGGPATDQTWMIEGPGSGTVAGVAFSEVEDLRGGDGNRDTFVFGPSGTIFGSVEGGNGGYDTVVLDGGSFRHIAFTASAPDAGTIARDGDLIRYTGFEPITVNAAASTVTVTATGAGADTIIIRDTGGAGDGQMEIFLSAGELHSITNAGTITELIIEGGVGDDVISLESVDSTFTGKITIRGGDDTDTFVAPDVAATWTITGVDAGTYEAAGQPKVSFESVGSITGAATAADAFEFETGSGLTGLVNDGAGTLTVSVAGFVKVGGNLDFARQSGVTLTYDSASGPATTVTNGNVLTVSGAGGPGTTGFVGVEPFDSPLGVQGVLGAFALAILTDGTRGWHAAEGTLTNPSAVGFGGSLSLQIPSATIRVNDEADDDTWLDFTTTQVTAGPVTFDDRYNSTLLSVTVAAVITIDQVVHISGQVTLSRGGQVLVDVATGLDAASQPTEAAALQHIPTTVTDTANDLYREADYSVIHNVRVTTLQISANDVTVFLGWNMGWVDDGDGILQRSELGTGAVGFFAENIDVGFVLASAEKTGIEQVDSAISLRFLALKATAALFEVVGIPELAIEVRNIAVEVNSGKAWRPLVAGSPVAVIDWAASFPDGADPDDDPDGFPVITGGDPVRIDFDGTKLIGISVDRALLRIADAVHLSGAFSFRIGEVHHVDIVTGLTAAQLATLPAINNITVSSVADADGDGWEEDPGGTTLARSTDGGIIYNVPVTSLLVGASGVSVFFGWAPGISNWVLATDDDGVLSRTELDTLTAGDRIGVFISGLDLGLAVLSPNVTDPVLRAALPRLVGLDSFADEAGWVGFEDEFELTFRGVALEVNRGTPWIPASPTSPIPVVDWVASFGTGGLDIPTGTTTETFALTHEAVSFVGVSADKALLQISDAVLISGAFSVRLGAVRYVDVATNLTSLPPSLTALASKITTVSATDPGGTTLARTSDWGIIWNLPVNTFELGFTDASVFFGWAPGLSDFSLDTDDDGLLDRGELDTLTGDDPATSENEADRTGLFVSGLRLGLVTLAPTAGGALTGVSHLLPKFFAFNSFADDAGWVGFEEHFELTARHVSVRANQGTVWSGVPPGTPAPTVDWRRSFGSAGFSVRTGSTEDESDPLALDFEGTPMLRVSADRMLLQISDAVLITGGFSLELGPVEHVDVVTGLNGAPAPGPLLTALSKIAVSSVADADGDGWEEDPGGTDLARSSDYGIIYNVPVATLKLGISAASVFLGWAPGLSAWGIEDGNVGDVDGDGILDRSELDTLTAGNRTGVFVSDLRLGMMLMSPVPFTGLLLGVDKLLPRLFALDSFAVDAGWVGFEEHFQLSLRNVAVEVNQGTPWTGAVLGTPNPAVDWKRSFGATGFAVPTDTTGTAPPVQLDFEGTPLIGFSADKVILQISDAVLITGSFSFRIGPVQLVDVATGIVGAGVLASPAALNSIPTASALTTAGGSVVTDMWRADDFSMIHNLRVNTIEFGASSVSAFVGWAPGLGVYDLAHAFAADGVLSRTEFNTLTGDNSGTSVYDGDAIGVFLENLRLGLLLMNPVPLTGPTAATLNPVLPRLIGLSSFADSAAWVGFNEHFELELRNIAVEVNQGTPWAGVAPGTPNPAVDWKQSFPDTDGAGTDDAAGYEVRTGTTAAATPVLLDFDGTPLIGFSADKVILQISDAVLITGGFSFRIGPVQRVDVATGLQSDVPLTVGPTALNFVPTSGSVADPTVDLWRSDDYSMLHNVRVNTLEFGASNVSVFLGWAPGLGAYNLNHTAAADGVLSRAEFDTLTGGDAIGFFLENLTLGLLLMSPVPLAVGPSNPNAAAINAVLPKLFGMRATADSMGLVGLESFLELTARGIVVEINQGSPWLGAIPGMPNPVVDWKQSFPDTDGAGTNDAAGYEVRTGTTAAAPTVLLDFDGTPLIGVSADAILLQISDFIHVSGAFSFRIGPVRSLDIATGLTTVTCPSAAPVLAVTTTVSATEMYRSSDCSMLHNVRMNTIEVGTSGLSVFVGYGPGISAWTLETDTDGVLSKAEFEALTGDSNTADTTYDGDAVGFFLENLTLGLMMMSPVPLTGPTAAALNPLLPKLFALKADADSLALIGVPGIELSGTGVRVEVNLGSKVVPSALLPAGVDWLSSFPDTDGAGTADQAGFEVPTGTSTDPVLFDMKGFLIGGGAENVHIELGDFVYLDGAIYFEYGAVHQVELADALLPVTEMLTALGLDSALGDVIGATSKELSFLNIGAKDLHAFFGVNGPYWIDADDDGVIDRYPTGHANAGQIIDAETNDDAIGLVIDDLTFGLSFMTPTNILDPSRYIAIVGEANLIGLVGLEDYLVMRAEDLTLELNISTPLVSGFPLLPVVDFAKTFESSAGANDGAFGVKTGARDQTTGEDITVDLTMDSLLIRAGVGFVSMNVMDAVTLNGSIGFELGKTETVILANGTTKQVKVLTIGATNVYAFLGFNGPYVADWNGNGYIDRADFHTNTDGTLGAPKLLNDGTGARPKAVGFAINDLDLGIFVGLELEAGLGDGPAPSLGVYVAGFLNIGSFGVVGLAGLTAMGTLGASFNVGASTSGSFSAINFEASFPAGVDNEGNPIAVGYHVFTGDLNNPILLQFDDFLFKIELAGGINLANTFALSGLFSLEIDSQGLKLLAAGQMVIGPDLASYNHSTGAISGTPMLFIEALGALVINGSGIALDIDIDIDVNVPGLDLSASARALINTIGGSAPQEITVSQRLLDFLADLASRGGVDASLGTDLLARLQPCSFDAAKRCYTIDHRAPNILHAPTLFNLLNNPTGSISRLAAGPYVVIALSGTFDFVGFAQGTGVGGIGISSGAGGTTFQFYFKVNFSIGTAGIELNFEAEGAIEIAPAGIYINVSVSLDADITSLFHLDVAGQLQIDTRPLGTSNDYFILNLNGRLDVAGLISVRGGLEIRVGGPAQTVAGIFYPGGADAWRVSIINLTGDFGPLTITLNGFVQSDGQFSVDASAGIHLGIDGFGINGTIGAGASLIKVDYNGDGIFANDEFRLRFYISGSVSVEAFGFDVAGASITTSAEGRLGTSVTINVEVCVDLLFDEACTDFDLFDIQLPSTILPQSPPKLAEFPVGSSVLELNVGTNASRRRSDLQGYTAENYRLTQLAPGEVKVELLDASGRTVAWQVFSGVTSITGNFGTDDDKFVFLAGATIPVTISGGIGHDTLSYLGSGSATLNGDAGNDTLTGGSGADTLNGGDHDDYLDGRGGIDTINGGAGNDILFGLITNLFGATPETLNGGGDTDLVEIVGTGGSDSFTVSTTTAGGVTLLQITYTGASPGTVLIQAAERILLNPMAGADTIQLTGELEDSGITEFKIIMGDGATDAIDRVTMTLLGTIDVVDITGGQAAGLTSNVRGDGVLPAPTYTGGGSAAAVAQTVVSWSGHYTLTLNNSGATQADLLTIQTGGDDDKVQVKSLASNTRIEGGDGDDRIAVGSNATQTTNTGGTLEAIDAALTIVGGAPTASDVLLIDDSGDPDGETGLVTSTKVTGFGLDSAGITYSEIETLTITLGSGTDTVNVHSTYVGATTTINGGGNSDTFNLSSDAPTNLGNLNSIAGSLIIVGGSAADTANLSDRSDGGVSDTGVLAADTLTGYSPGVITYLQIETLNLDLGAGATNLTIVSPGATTVNVNAGATGDVVYVTSVAAGTTVTVNGEDTSDTIVVNSNDGTLIINGNGGDDDITVNSSAGTITINGDAGRDFVKIVGLSGTGTVNGGGDDDDIVVRNLTGTLTVNGDTGHDWVGILATALGSTLTVNGNDGDDIFEVGSNAEVGATSAARRALDEGGILDGVDGAVTINGNAPSASDWLYLDDSGDDAPSSGEAGLLTSTTITGLGMATGITYGTVEHLEISLGDDGTVFNVKSTNAGTDSVLQTGGGSDTINVSSDLTLASLLPNGTGTADLIAGHLTVHGEAGHDVAHVSDAGDGNDNTGELTTTDLTGLDMGLLGITYLGLELLDIDLGAGHDTFLVTSTHLTQTTIDGAAGTDAVNIRTIAGHTIVTGGSEADTITVGTLAPALGGTLNGINALLEVVGNGGDDEIIADDTGDSGSNVGVVTSTTIEGLGMTVGSAHSGVPSSVVHRITIANAFDGTFTITIGSSTTAPIDFDASADAIRSALLAALAGTPGLDASDIQIARVLHGLELTYVIAFVGDLAGLAGHSLGSLSVNGSALIGLADYGTATASAASSTTGRIVYSEIEDLDILLGGGVDVFHVRSTHAGTTDVAGGDSNDVLLVETIGGTTTVQGQGDDDTLVINPLAGIPAATNGLGDSDLTADGNEGSDLYIVNIWSNGSSELSIHDSGVDPSGTDRLTVNGTDGVDTFLVRAGYVAALTNPNAAGAFHDAERINYDSSIDAGITINALGGADLVAFDDNSSLTTVNGGDGDDRFQVGQLFGDDPDDTDDLNVDTDLISTTRGELSNGVSEATTINGGSGNDQFQIFHNVGVLQLNGDSGDDTFIIRTFLGRDGGTGINAGLGRDLIDYIWNAPVSIDGGDGFDTVVIIGTEADDEFVITADGVYGAGRFVAFTGVEQLDVDGAEGDDTFTVVSTAPGVLVRVFGGLGSDLISVGADANAVYGDDLQGHTGLIAHSVESTCAMGAASGCGAFDGIAVDGVAGEILDDEEPLVLVVQSGGGTVVSEQGATDSYLVVLNQAPTSEVRVTVSAPSRSPEAELHRSYSIEVSRDGTSWFDALTLVFNALNWATPQTIHVRAHGDLSSEGERSAALQHLVVSADASFAGLPINNVIVRVIDDEQAGLVLIESGVDTVVTESGMNDTYTIGLARPSLTSVTVTVTGDDQVCVSTAADANLDCGPVTLTFAAGDSTVRTITVRAKGDGAVESFHFGYLTTAVASTAPGTEVIPGSVTAVSGTRITITSATQFTANSLRGYLLRITGGGGAGQSWAIWSNLASTGGPGAWVTVITIQGLIEVTPGVGAQAHINGYVAPVLTQALTGTITHIDGAAVDGTGTVLTVGSLSTPLPVANGGLSGALIRIFNPDGTTEYRRVASNTASTITIDSTWTLTIGQEFSILDLEGIAIPKLAVLVADDDTPGVLITETDGSTNLAEGATSPTLGLLYDTYSVVLTRAPVAGETVTVWVTPTISETLHQDDGAAGYRTLQQLCVSTSAPAAGATCLDGARTALTFTAANWNTPQTVYVWAKPDAVRDGSDLQDFADAAQRVYLIQGPLHVDGGGDEYADRSIPDPILLPGESSGPLPTPLDPAFDAVEDRQVDTLDVHNEDSISDDTGTLTSTRLWGLGMGPDQFVGGRFLAGGITYDDLEALRIRLGQGDDTLTILSTHTGTTVVTGNSGDDTFHIETIDGHTNLSGDAGDDTFLIGTAAHTLDDLHALLVIDGGAGSDDAVADDSSDPVGDHNLGTLTQTTLTGLEMVSTALNRLFSLTIGSTTTHVTFTITIPGRPAVVELTLPVGFTAAELAAALQDAIFPTVGTVTGCGTTDVTPELDTPCSQSVFVWAHGGDFLIGFQGELRGIDVGLSVVGAAGTATDLARVDGINYYGFATSEQLTILLGSGNDRFNVRGTLPHTILHTAGGDDVVFVSDSADLAGLPAALAAAGGSLTSVHDAVLHGHVQVDDLGFDGSLDDIDGDLDIDTGTGSNTLAVSDRDDPDADTGAVITNSAITGFSDGDLTYTSTGGDLAGQGAWALLHDSGMFGRGITVHAGTGDDGITISSVRGGALASSALQMTITTLYANDGGDTVVVTAPAVAGARLVVHGEDGEDTIDAQGGSSVASLPLIVFGEDGDDTIQGGSGADILFGDHGRVFLFDDGAGYDVILGGNPTTIPDNVLPGGSSLGQNQPDDHVFETIDVVMSLYDGETDDDDVIRGGDGDDLVIGGVGSDALDGEDDRDIVVGDQAILTRNVGGTSPTVRELSGATLYDGVKVDHELDPNMGPLAWTITLLDHANGTPAHLYGNDVAAGGSDEDYVFGQLGIDTLHGDGVLVSDGSGWWTIGPNGTTADDADDHIEGGGGTDTIFGGLGQDSIIGGSSDLFGLVTAAQRADGADTVYGGNGDRIARNDLGTTHGRDADVILGDNGRIFRIVGPSGAFLSFVYDNGYGEQIIPRHVSILDYSPVGEAGYWYAPLSGAPSDAVWTTGLGTNIGGGDFLHGEAGDDVIYGATGADAIFGEAQDDDLYGGSGDDWISGGTGDDGIITDDGRLFTSRNGQTEPLCGLTVANQQRHLETPGDLQMADIYLTGELHKAAELDLPIAGQTFSTFYVGANDIAYGGWGNDFIHGGEGDDALSGAEALPLYYTSNPWQTLRSLDYMVDDFLNNRGVLQWGVAREGEFLLYDEFNPLARVTVPTGEVFLLVNAADENAASGQGDGKDTIFGDGGNDWIVGGTNHDRLFGGWGDDLLNADDDPDTNGGANDAPDAQTAPPSYADIAYGGAGRDILIANTGADRLIDWVGEFNSYVVPYSPFGALSISRSNSPALRQYLLDLGRGSGADVTRGGDPARNGEPFGELGMVIQQDPWWGDQTGAPADPQPGNTQGRRDVLRAESFASAAQALDAFAVDSGTWRVVNGRYESVASIGGDAVSLFYVDAALPRYYEVVGTVSSDKAKGGYKSNAYLVFDYQGTTDFKFAGIDIGLGKVQIGRRTASGWEVLAQANLSLVANRDYELVLVVNGQQVTLYVDGVARLTHTFASPLIDPTDPSRGVVDPLNDGMVGVGSSGSIMRLGEMSVRVLTPEITFTSTDELDALPAEHSTSGGTWTVGGGRYTGTPGADAALSLTSLGVSSSSTLIASTKVSTASRAGLVFDAYGPGRFKYVLLDVAGDRIVIGHRTTDGWFEDRVLALDLVPGRTYDLRITMRGSTVTVWLDGSQVLTHTFNSILSDGDVGLLAMNGPGTFDVFTLQTDDPEMVPALPFVSVADVAVVEGSGGHQIVVTVTLSRPSDVPVTVQWSTADGSAVAGSDYTSASGTVTIAPGETSQQITLWILGDSVQELDETFTVVLTGPSGAILGDASGTVTILNDDVPATVTVGVPDPAATEGGDTASFTVTRTGDLSAPLTVRLSWGGTAVRSVDYSVGISGGTLGTNAATLTFAAGSATATLTITALVDSAAEAVESVVLTLLADAAYGIGSPSSGTATIEDAASLPTLSVSDGSGVEGDRGGTWVNVTVTLSRASTSTVTVQFRTYDGTARAGDDYRSEVLTLTFAPGQTSLTVAIRVLSDRLREGNETFTVQLSTPSGAALARSVGTVTIVDDDGGTMLAAAAPTGRSTATPLTERRLSPVLDAAIAWWAARGADPAALAEITIVITDLPGLVLARTEGTTIYVDRDAAGHGWFVDATPEDSVEFVVCAAGTGTAMQQSPAAGHMDLLTVLLHELGHVLGLDHDAHVDVMASTLRPGERLAA